ncbi:MAG: hypothetical protein AUJ49_02180 [Desulfovibrionaceae bacterium CG1_02_65_16]|nr:MAG: hypothetical protein AUJ49_02180 [Desulfovibrionaceae bacterium CG1_02_65_16]
MALLSLRAKSPWEALLRLVGMCLVMGLAVFGFWKNSERNMERIAARTAARSGLADETGGLTEGQRAHVLAFIETMRKNYGVVARVRISRVAPTPPEADGKTLFIGLGLDGKSALVRLPPMMDRALGPEFAANLERQHFPFHFAPGRSWQKGLLAALDLIESRLAAMDAAAQPQPPIKPKENVKDTP